MSLGGLYASVHLQDPSQETRYAAAVADAEQRLAELQRKQSTSESFWASMETRIQKLRGDIASLQEVCSDGRASSFACLCVRLVGVSVIWFGCLASSLFAG